MNENIEREIKFCPSTAAGRTILQIAKSLPDYTIAEIAIADLERCIFFEEDSDDYAAVRRDYRIELTRLKEALRMVHVTIGEEISLLDEEIHSERKVKNEIYEISEFFDTLKEEEEASSLNAKTMQLFSDALDIMPYTREEMCFDIQSFITFNNPIGAVKLDFKTLDFEKCYTIEDVKLRKFIWDNLKEIKFLLDHDFLNGKFNDILEHDDTGLLFYAVIDVFIHRFISYTKLNSISGARMEENG